MHLEAPSLRSCEWGVLKHDKIRGDVSRDLGVSLVSLGFKGLSCCFSHDGRGDPHSSFSSSSLPTICTMHCNRSKPAGHKDRQESEQVVLSRTAHGWAHLSSYLDNTTFFLLGNKLPLHFFELLLRPYFSAFFPPQLWLYQESMDICCSYKKQKAISQRSSRSRSAEGDWEMWLKWTLSFTLL